MAAGLLIDEVADDERRHRRRIGRTGRRRVDEDVAAVLRDFAVLPVRLIRPVRARRTRPVAGEFAFVSAPARVAGVGLAFADDETRLVVAGRDERRKAGARPRRRTAPVPGRARHAEIARLLHGHRKAIGSVVSGPRDLAALQDHQLDVLVELVVVVHAQCPGERELGNAGEQVVLPAAAVRAARDERSLQQPELARVGVDRRSPSESDAKRADALLHENDVRARENRRDVVLERPRDGEDVLAGRQRDRCVVEGDVRARRGEVAAQRHLRAGRVDLQHAVLVRDRAEVRPGEVDVSARLDDDVRARGGHLAVLPVLRHLPVLRRRRVAIDPDRRVARVVEIHRRGHRREDDSGTPHEGVGKCRGDARLLLVGGREKPAFAVEVDERHAPDAGRFLQDLHVVIQMQVARIAE